MSLNAYPIDMPVAARTWQGSSRLHWIRAGAVAGQAVLLAIVHGAPDQQKMALLMLAGCIAAGATAAMLGLQHLRREHLISDAAFFRQILIDLAVLTYMLAISGGPTNPFHDAYFLPVAVAAALLPARQTWWVVAASLACYTLVQFVYLPLPGDPQHLARLLGPGEWITHALMVSLAAFFLLRITQDLRERERKLCQARETAARAECAVAIGSVAAGAAHELGTPLMTISTVLDDLQAEHGHRAELRPSLNLLAAGVAECRTALDTLRQSGSSLLAGPERVPVSVMVNHVLARFRGMRPGVTVRLHFEPPRPEPVIDADVALQQAVINLLSNAAAASPDFVALSIECAAGELRLRVTDRGPGLAPEIARQLGKDLVSTKPAGMGLGLFLTEVTVQRLGGSFQIRNADEGGAVAQIVLPLASLQSARS